MENFDIFSILLIDRGYSSEPRGGGSNVYPQSMFLSKTIYSYMPGVLFVGHRPDVTPQNAASHLGLFCLHREISSKYEIENENHS